MRWLGIFCVAVFPCVASAQGCDEAETTLEMGMCLQDALREADDTLNQTYRLAMDGLQYGDDAANASVARSLQAAQRAWIGYRDLACTAERALFDGGSMAGIAMTGCLLRLTEERINGLYTFLSD